MVPVGINLVGKMGDCRKEDDVGRQEYDLQGRYSCQKGDTLNG